MPKDFDEFCVGCTTCFMKDEKGCPHYQKLAPLTKALVAAIDWTGVSDKNKT